MSDNVLSTAKFYLKKLYTSVSSGFSEMYQNRVECGISIMCFMLSVIASVSISPTINIMRYKDTCLFVGKAFPSWVYVLNIFLFYLCCIIAYLLDENEITKKRVIPGLLTGIIPLTSACGFYIFKDQTIPIDVFLFPISY